MRTYQLILTPVAAALILTAIGCKGDENRRLAEMAERHLERQAEQSRQVTELQREVAEGSRRLVEADAQARQEMVALQHEVQAERNEVGQQRDLLEEDRRQLAEQRRQDPIIAAAITQVGMVVACVLPLVVCWYLLHREPTQSDDATVTEVLIEDLIVERPLLLPSSAERRAAIACEDPPNAHESCDLDQPVG